MTSSEPVVPLSLAYVLHVIYVADVVITSQGVEPMLTGLSVASVEKVEPVTVTRVPP